MQQKKKNRRNIELNFNRLQFKKTNIDTFLNTVFCTLLSFTTIVSNSFNVITNWKLPYF